MTEEDIGTRETILPTEQDTIDRYTNLPDSDTDIGFDPTGHADPRSQLLTKMTTKTLRNYLIQDVQHWLTGDNIDNISDILNMASPPPNTPGSYHFVSSRLMQLLYFNNKYDYSKVKTWGRTRGRRGNNFFDYDTLYFPFNFTGNHWTGAIVKLKEKKIIYRDSMNEMDNPRHAKKGRMELQTLKQYLTDEIQRRRGITGWEGLQNNEIQRLGKPKEWETIRNTRNNMIQENIIDCGICYLANMLYDTQNRLPLIHITHMPLFRKQIFTLLMRYHNTNTLPPNTTPIIDTQDLMEHEEHKIEQNINRKDGDETKGQIIRHTPSTHETEKLQEHAHTYTTHHTTTDYAYENTPHIQYTQSPENTMRTSSSESNKRKTTEEEGKQNPPTREGIG